MTIPNRPTGQDPQSTWLWNILKQLDKLTGIASTTAASSASGLTNTELRATPVGVTQSSQPLPTNASTSTKQSDGTQKTQTIDALGINSESRFRVLKQLVTRPANITPVIANGVLTDVSTLISKFVNANKSAGYGLMITDFRIQTNDTGIAGKTFRLHIYDDTVTPTTYNTAFALDDANATKRRGKLDAVFSTTGNLVKVASNLTDAIIVTPAATDLYFKLECVEGYTPSANSTWFEVQLGVIQTN
jgi:hypothetical protein